MATIWEMMWMDPRCRRAGRERRRGSHRDRALSLRSGQCQSIPMPQIEITAFRWVPDFAQGVVRDLRARWALEEAGLDYRVRLLDQRAAARISEGTAVRPGAVLQRRRGADLRERRDRPIYRRAERGAAAARSAGPVSARSSGPMPRSTASSRRSSTCSLIDIFYAGEEWAKLRRPGAERFRAG